MITTTDKNRIVQVLGGNYSSKIIPFLNKKKIYNSFGKPFSPKAIQKIMNATDGREDLAVEQAIVQLVQNEIARKAAIQKAKKKTLK